MLQDMSAVRAVMAAVRGGPDARLCVLIYHRVPAQVDPMYPDEPDAAAFDARMAFVAARFNVLPLDEAIERVGAGTLPRRALCITFDDGYADNFHVALPILRKHRLPATIFVASGFLDGGRMWNDTIIEAVRRAPPGTLDLCDIGLGAYRLDGWVERRAAVAAILDALKYRASDERQDIADRIGRTVAQALPNDLMLTTSELRGLHSAGICVGGHTVTHPILLRTPADAAREEIRKGRADLEARLGAPVRLFAYPNGKAGRDFGPEHVRMVREAGFHAAFTTDWGAASQLTPRFELPRFTPWDRSNWRFGMRLVHNAVRSGSPAEGTLEATEA